MELLQDVVPETDTCSDVPSRHSTKDSVDGCTWGVAYLRMKPRVQQLPHRESRMLTQALGGGQHLQITDKESKCRLTLSSG